MPAADHALVVGGTGMLRAVSLALAQEHACVSIIARSHARLASLAQQVDRIGGTINPIAVDWHDTQRLALGLRTAIAARGPIRLAVCWIHSDAHDALRTVLDQLADERDPPRCFHIIGSDSLDPTRAVGSYQMRAHGVKLRRITLGFILDADRARWLTNDEIARGVLEAVRSNQLDSTIGIIAPQRPCP